MLGTQNISHINSFNTHDSVEGVATATREAVTRTIFDKMYMFEGFGLRNSSIANGAMTGSVSESVRFGEYNTNNAFGSYRASAKPKKLMGDFVPITGLADVKFSQFNADQFTLQINRPLESEKELIYTKLDGKWIQSDIENAAQGTALNSAVTTVNYETYKLFPEAAYSYVDPILGKSAFAFGGFGTATDKEYTDALIDQIARYQALPNDRYVYGFGNDENIIIMSPAGKAALVKEKLVIFDGSLLNMESEYYTGFPYTFRFNGFPVISSAFLNAPGAVTDGIFHIITTVGRFGPLQFDVPFYQGIAEVMPGTGNAIAIYSQILWGANIAPIFKQYVTLGFKEAITDFWSGFNITAVSTDNSTAAQISVTGTMLGVAGAVNIFKTNSTTSLQSESLTIDTTSTVIMNTGIEAGVEYRIEITTGETDVINGTTYELATTVYATGK